ncbi:MAG: hypothetical protein ACLUGP_07980 [Faecalibacterium prausnitzii]
MIDTAKLNTEELGNIIVDVQTRPASGSMWMTWSPSCSTPSARQT